MVPLLPREVHRLSLSLGKYLFFEDFIYLFERERERECLRAHARWGERQREKQTPAEQGARCGT